MSTQSRAPAHRAPELSAPQRSPALTQDPQQQLGNAFLTEVMETRPQATDGSFGILGAAQQEVTAVGTPVTLESGPEADREALYWVVQIAGGARPRLPGTEHDPLLASIADVRFADDLETADREDAAFVETQLHRLEAATGSTDPAWLETTYRPAVARLLQSIREEAACTDIDRVGDATQEFVPLLDGLDQLEALTNDAELISTKAVLDGALMGVETLVDVTTGAPVGVGSLGDIIEWVRSTRDIVTLYRLSQQDAPTTDELDFAKYMASAIKGSLAAGRIVGRVYLTAMELGGAAPEALAAARSSFAGLARVGRSMSGVFTVISVASNLAVLADAEASLEKKADAVGGLAMAAGSAIGLPGFPVFVAVMGTTATFKASFQLMGETRFAAVNSALLEDLHRIDPFVSAILEADRRGAIGRGFAEQEDDAEWSAAYGHGAEASYAMLEQPLHDLRGSLAGLNASEIPRRLRSALDSGETHADKAAAIREAMSFLVQNWASVVRMVALPD